MPTYVFKCKEHGDFNEIRRMADCSKPAKCPECGAPAKRNWMVTKADPRAVKVIGTGDTTTAVYGDDGKPYRFKESGEKSQKKEIIRQLEKQQEHLPERLRDKFDVQ